MFERRGVLRAAMFDVDERVIATSVNGIEVLSMDTLENYIAENGVDIAVLTTPKDAAQPVAERLAKAGVRGIWNFSNMELSLPAHSHVWIENIHMGDSLMLLCYQMKARAKGKGD
jgi:redox-sensing transcriptional repressor